MKIQSLAMRLIDTHTHLYDEAFDTDREIVLHRVRQAGVCKCVLPAIDKSYYARESEFAECHRGFAYEAMGLHPTSVQLEWQGELEFVMQRLEENPARYKAVGEIGLDGYWSREFMEEQMHVFREQLLLSIKYDLPVIIHLRDATDEFYSVMDSIPKSRLRGVLHAFTGSVETYRRVKQYGEFKVGIGGVVTYKKASVAQTLTEIPLRDILLETDSPWLTPVPFRGRRNESSYITYIAEKIAEIKGADIEEVAETTSLNAEELFGI